MELHFRFSHVNISIGYASRVRQKIRNGGAHEREREKALDVKFEDDFLDINIF